MLVTNPSDRYNLVPYFFNEFFALLYFLQVLSLPCSTNEDNALSKEHRHQKFDFLHFKKLDLEFIT